jgi:hypothetical protein
MDVQVTDADEDSKLASAVKNIWRQSNAIATLVPGRPKDSKSGRWYACLNHITKANGQTGT